MRMLSTLALIAVSGLLLGCDGPPVKDVCQFQADCWYRNCDWNDQACQAQVEPRKQQCMASYNMTLDALAVSKGEPCRVCESATIALLECLDKIPSCYAWDRALNPDGGACYQEHVDAQEQCQDIVANCYR